jgi:8-oxo-dGTP diphosphatase
MQHQKIAIGVIINEAGKILVSKRKNNVHLPEVWEFPGGKLEAGESFKQALRREIYEEVGVKVRQCKKIIDFNYSYDDRHLYFQAFTVHIHSDQVTAKEQQKIMWLDQGDLSQIDFPAANQSILNAINLPHSYLIADYSVFGNKLFDTVRANLAKGISQLQFRAPSINKEEYLLMANELYELCHRHNARLILNCDVDWYRHACADGLHLSSQRLKKFYNAGADLADIEIYSASCHSLGEVDYANALSVSTILIGPVLHTHSHPWGRPLGWPGFSSLCAHANMPVYAIGGLGKNDIQTALVNGAQGIAGIRDFTGA